MGILRSFSWNFDDVGWTCVSFQNLATTFSFLDILRLAKTNLNHFATSPKPFSWTSCVLHVLGGNKLMIFEYSPCKMNLSKICLSDKTVFTLHVFVQGQITTTTKLKTNKKRFTHKLKTVFMTFSG